MKRTLLFFCLFGFFILAYFNRYQPVALDRVAPTTKTIEVKGQVNNPGIYNVKWEARVSDAIEAAGGLTQLADIQDVSMAKMVNDNDVIVIRKIEEKKKVSLNSATLEELCTLPGIGEAIATRILEYRNETSFTSLEQIKEVKGIGDKMFEKIKDEIVL